jgi:hypothetical protein
VKYPAGELDVVEVDTPPGEDEVAVLATDRATDE